MYEELIERCFANASNGISEKDITLREAAYAIRELLNQIEELNSLVDRVC